jgi:hypothetical protein
MPVSKLPGRLMAPFFRDLFAATADAKVRKPEVRKNIVPWSAELNEPAYAAYRQQVEALAAGKQPGVITTATARKALELLLSEPKQVADRFSPAVDKVSYTPGMGIRPRVGQYAGPKAIVTLCFSFIDVKPTSKVYIDERRKVVSVYIEGTSESTNHSRAAVRPYDLEVNLPRPVAVSATYTLVVRDGNTASTSFGKELARTTFDNVMPC